MLVQPVDRYLKKVEVDEEIVEEKQTLLEDKHKDIVRRKDSNGEHYNGARKLSETASLKDNNGAKTYNSHHNLSKKSEKELNGTNGVKNGKIVRIVAFALLLAIVNRPELIKQTTFYHFR